MITTTVTFSGGYTRGPFLGVTRCRDPETKQWDWRLQWYYTDGHGGAKYNPSIPGHRYKRKWQAMHAKRTLLAKGARP